MFFQKPVTMQVHRYGALLRKFSVGTLGNTNSTNSTCDIYSHINNVNHDHVL